MRHRPISRSWLPPRRVTVTHPDGSTTIEAPTGTPRTAPRGWFPNNDVYGTWAPTAVTRLRLIAGVVCAHCALAIPVGAPAISATGASRRATYHPACAKGLGYRPTS